jgi:hypothetical protein
MTDLGMFVAYPTNGPGEVWLHGARWLRSVDSRLLPLVREQLGVIEPLAIVPGVADGICSCRRQAVRNYERVHREGRQRCEVSAGEDSLSPDRQAESLVRRPEV